MIIKTTTCVEILKTTSLYFHQDLLANVSVGICGSSQLEKKNNPSCKPGLDFCIQTMVHPTLKVCVAPASRQRSTHVANVHLLKNVTTHPPSPVIGSLNRIMFRVLTALSDIRLSYIRFPLTSSLNLSL